MIQLTLTLKMTTAQAVETSVTVNNNSLIQDYVHRDDQTQPFENNCYLEIYTIDLVINKNVFTSVALRPFETSNPASAELNLMHSSHSSFS